MNGDLVLCEWNHHARNTATDDKKDDILDLCNLHINNRRYAFASIFRKSVEVPASISRLFTIH